MTEPEFQPIANALIRKIFVVASLCAVMFAAMEAGLAYREERQHFDDALRDIGLTNVALLSVLIWDIEPQTVQRQIQVIADRPQIGYVRLQVRTGRVFEAGTVPGDSTVVLDRFNIPAPYATGAASLGTLEIGANRASLYAEVLKSASVAVTGYGLLTVLICLVIAVILRRDLQQPLTSIARLVGQLDPERLSEPITLQRPDDHHRHDEIDIVLEGFRTLQNGIDKHISNLDQLVAERTVKLEVAMAEIHLLSITDPLTRCFNRRLFNERIVQEFERAKRYERPLSLIFCDIDHFKQINDAFGHTTGDEILSQVSECYRVGLRADIDWVARYGGEEFVIVLPETERESARATAERQRAAIAERVFTSQGRTLHVTSSFGVAQLHTNESIEAFLNRADQAVYQAKAQGRDRVV